MNSLVYIVDPCEEVSNNISALLKNVGFNCKAFKTGNEFLSSYDKNSAGCAIIDIDVPFKIEDTRVSKLSYLLPKHTGLVVQSEMKSIDITIPVILTSDTVNIEATSRGFRAGAIDVLNKPLSPEILVDRILESLKIDIFNINYENDIKHIKSALEKLSPRENETLEQLIKGYSHKKIAKILGISNRTVDVHIAHIKNKTNKSIPELISNVLHCNYNKSPSSYTII